MPGTAIGDYQRARMGLPPAQQQQMPQPQSVGVLDTRTTNSPINPNAGPATGQYVDPSTGQMHTYATDPNLTTNLYQTGTGGVPNTTGTGTISNPSYEQQQQAQLDALLKSGQMDKAAALQAEAEKRRLGYLSQIPGFNSPNVPDQTGPAADETAARGAAFARAKEQAGSTALASMKALQDVLAEKGQMGGSVEGNLTASILGGAGHDVNDFTRTQLIQDLNRAADVSDRNYAGRITQRGQNMSQLPSLLSLITSTGGGVY